MTFYVDFYAEQAFLSFAQKHIAKPDKFDLEDGAVAILACASALEAILNRIFESKQIFRHYDRLNIAKKIDTVADFGKLKIDWGTKPWQDIAQLIRVRNWLAHYKDSTIGLINSDSKWIKDDINKIPKIDPGYELSRKYCTKYYKTVIECCKDLSNTMGLQIEFGYLNTEQYEPIIVG